MVAVADGTWIALGGMAVTLGLLLLIGVAMFRRPGDIQAELGALKVTLKAVHQAVNDRPKNAPTLSADVAMIVGQLDTLTTSIVDRDKRVDARLDSLDGRVATLTTDLATLTAHVMTNPGLPTQGDTHGT